MECAAVGDKSALVAVPLKSYTSAKQCYDDGLQTLLTTGLDTYLASTSTQRTAYTKALSTEGKRQASLINLFEQFSGSKVTKQFLITIRKFITGNGFDVLAELEEKYDCSGVCEVPLFGITRNIKEGRPTQECAAGIYHAMKGSYKAEAAFSIICSLVLWCAMTAAIMIWQGPDDEDGEDGDKTDAAKEGDVPERAKTYEQTTELQNQAPATAINDGDKVGLPPVEDKKVE